MDDELRGERAFERAVDWAGGGYDNNPQSEEDRQREEEARLAQARREREIAEHLARRKALRDQRWTQRAAAGTGLVLGRFLPVHHGHLHLIEVARALTPELTVLVSAQPDDPIAGGLRVAWLRELVPTARVELGQGLTTVSRGNGPVDFAWLDAAEDLVVRHCAERPAVLYGSGQEHQWLASRLEVPLRSVDPQREGVPVSGTAIRGAVLAHWSFLPPPVRAHLARRVAVVGPEGVGKSSLTQKLRQRYDTVSAPEAARAMASLNRGTLEQPAFEAAVAMQRASEASLARQANGVLFCDSNALAMEHMMARWWKKAPPWVSLHAREDAYDLTLVLSAKLPYVGDPKRDDEFARGLYTKKLVATLTERRVPHVVLAQPEPEARFAAAVAAVEAMLRAPGFVPARFQVR